jgi:hypothetical protein
MTDTNSAYDALEEALKETFPASDPISVQQPVVARGVSTWRDLVDASEPARRVMRKQTNRFSSGC